MRFASAGVNRICIFAKTTFCHTLRFRARDYTFERMRSYARKSAPIGALLLYVFDLMFLSSEIDVAVAKYFSVNQKGRWENIAT